MSIVKINENELEYQESLITDSQDIKEILESNNVNPEFYQDITGVKVVFDGFNYDYFLTESSFPNFKYTDFDIIDYWID